MNQLKRKSIFDILAQHDPNPTTELHFDDVFELLVAVILSAQATDKSVNKATQRLFVTANTPQAMVELGEDGLKSFIRSIGLFNSKARNIVAMSEMLLAEHQGRVPDDRPALERLPGVGRKTANVILNTAFGKPTIAVDTHIFRVSNRTGIAPGRNVVEVEKKLLKHVPSEYQKNAHHWLILLGRYTCVARKPRCFDCPIHPHCDFKPKTPPPHHAAS